MCLIKGAFVGEKNFELLGSLVTNPANVVIRDTLCNYAGYNVVSSYGARVIVISFIPVRNLGHSLRQILRNSLQYVQMSYVEFHANRPINMDIKCRHF